MASSKWNWKNWASPRTERPEDNYEDQIRRAEKQIQMAQEQIRYIEEENRRLNANKSA
jgi:hypothetical protein